MCFCDQAAITDAIFANLRGIEELDMTGCYQAAVTPAGFEQLRGIETLSVGRDGHGSKHPLLSAILDKNTPHALHLIETNKLMWINATVIDIDGYMWSPLSVASYLGLDAVVLRLLKYGARANFNSDGRRFESCWSGPLRAACRGNKHSTVQLLVQWGADVNQQDTIGRTPIESTRSDDLKALLRSLGATE
jgi:hypothetical protein